jgi:hypothetical protein
VQVPLMLWHPSRQFSMTAKVNEIESLYGLFWLLDFIAANQKRVRKRIHGIQEWVFTLDAKHRATLKVFARTRAPTFPYRRTLHFTFKFTVLDYTGPPITFFLENGVLFTEGEPDADL